MSKTISADSLQGFKYFRLMAELVEQLHDQGCERDRAHNRQLFFDQYTLLMVLYFFNPIVDSLRGLQQLTTLEKVQRLCGVKATSLGSLSEAAGVFDPHGLEPILAELARRSLCCPATLPRAEEAALKGLVAVDGSLLKALPRMAWALWQSPTQRAAKMHVAFAVLPGVPVQVTVTAGQASERQEWRKMVQPGGFYVADRGYASFDLFRELDGQGCHFLVRVQQNTAFEVAEERVPSAEDRQAGVVRDVVLKRLGTDKHNALLERPLRLIQVRHPDHAECWLLVSNRLDLEAWLLVLAYQYRWQVELFFRWLKCVLGCRHLLSQSESGVTLQVYCAIIASLLIGLWTGRKPNKRTYEMICYYLSGWATVEEMTRHLKKVPAKAKPP